MLRRTSQPFAVAFFVTDLVATVVAWIGAYIVRFSGWLPIHKSEPGFDECLRTLPLVVILAAISYRLASMYKIHRMRRFREELVTVLKGTVLLSLLVLAAFFFSHDNYESRGTMALFTIGSTVGVMIARRIGWSFLRSFRKQGYNQTNAVIVGTGRIARETARALRRASWMGIRTLGYVEDHPSHWCSDLNVLGTTDELPTIIAKNDVEHVFIALPLNRFAEARKTFDILSQTFAEVRLVVDAPEMAGLSLTTNNLQGLPIIGLRESAHFGLNLIVKRCLDIVLSAIGLILLSPLFAVIAT